MGLDGGPRRSRPGFDLNVAPARSGSRLLTRIAQSMTTTTTRKPHALAIDDDAAMREPIAGYLGENDLRVTAAATGSDKEKVLARHAVDVVQA